MQETVKKLDAFLQDNSVSMSALARALGVSPSLISQFRSGSYKGDSQAIAAKINSYIDNHNKKSKISQPEPKKGEFFVSTDVKMANFVINEAILEREIALIYGAAGSGKTTILQEFAKNNPNVVLIEATCHTSAKVLLEDLCEALKIKVAARFLKSNDKIVMIDEAEHLPLRALEDLRRIYDFAKMPLILCGTQILLKNLMGKSGELRQLYSRICGKWTMRGLSEEECEKFYAKNIFEYSKGNFRSSSKLYKKALRLASLNECEIDEQIIEQATQMVILG